MKTKYEERMRKEAERFMNRKLREAAAAAVAAQEARGQGR
jgi:hypothetical protein